MMISVWTNPIAIFILIGAWTTEQSQVKRELLFCARVLIGEYTEIFFIKISRMPTYRIVRGSMCVVCTERTGKTEMKSTSIIEVKIV